MKPVIYVVVNKALNMSAGKLAAQVGHAIVGTCARYRGTDLNDRWLRFPHRWMIILEAKDGEQLYYLYDYLLERRVTSYRVIDEGVNEIRPFSITALGVGPLDKDSDEAQYLSGLKLYSDNMRQQLSDATERGFKNGVESRKWRNRFRILEFNPR